MSKSESIRIDSSRNLPFANSEVVYPELPILSNRPFDVTCVWYASLVSASPVVNQLMRTYLQYRFVKMEYEITYNPASFYRKEPGVYPEQNLKFWIYTDPSNSTRLDLDFIEDYQNAGAKFYMLSPSGMKNNKIVFDAEQNYSGQVFESASSEPAILGKSWLSTSGPRVNWSPVHVGLEGFFNYGPQLNGFFEFYKPYDLNQRYVMEFRGLSGRGP